MARRSRRCCPAEDCRERAATSNSICWIVRPHGQPFDRLRFDPVGKATIVAGTLPHGQGLETSYAQMVADWLGVPDDKIHLTQAETDEVTICRGLTPRAA